MSRSASPILISTAWISLISTRHFFDNALVITSHSKSWVAIGVNIRGLIVVVFARLGLEGVSIISMRPASRRERKRYAER